METVTVHFANNMQSLSARQCVGLPSLQPKRRGPKGQSTGPQLQRTWTLRGKGGSSTAAAALPLPFMEISVSVLDTLDLVRSSVEEEIVFQATMQVPAHHAIACRIEAYDTPFAGAPALQAADPSQLTEDDKKFAACLASPAELEEAHSISFARNPGGSLLQRSAPSLRFASGALTLSFSLRQRTSSQDQGGDDEPDKDLDRQQTLPEPFSLKGFGSLVDSHSQSLQPTQSSSPFQQQQHPQQQQQHQQGLASYGNHGSSGSSRLSQSSSSGSSFRPLNSSSSSSHRTVGPVHSRHSHCASIAEVAGEGSAGHAALAAAVCSNEPECQQQQQQQQQQRQQQQAPRQQELRGLMRVESFTSKGRRFEEAPFTAKLAHKAVATLLGVGYMMLHALEARTEPATNVLQYQLQGYTGPSSSPPSTPAAAAAWPPTPQKARC